MQFPSIKSVEFYSEELEESESTSARSLGRYPTICHVGVYSCINAGTICVNRQNDVCAFCLVVDLNDRDASILTHAISEHVPLQMACNAACSKNASLFQC